MKASRIIKTLLPEPLRAQSWIAGGFAFSPLTTADIDIWILSPSSVDISDLLGWFIQNRIVGQARDDTLFPSEDALEYEDNFPLAQRIYQTVYHNYPVDIMVVQTSDIQELLESFDYTPHCVAINHKDEKTFVRGYNTRGWYVNKTKSNTLTRYRRFTTRYCVRPSRYMVEKFAEELNISKEEKESMFPDLYGFFDEDTHRVIV